MYVLYVDALIFGEFFSGTGLNPIQTLAAIQQQQGTLSTIC
jgi:hypothetical protein